jgi:hypothetical protein
VLATAAALARFALLCLQSATADRRSCKEVLESMLWDGEDARVLGDYLSVSRTGRPDPLLKSSTDSVTISYKAALHDARFPKGVLHVRACPKYYGDAPWYDCVVINAGGPEVDEMIAEPAARNRYFAQVRSIVTSASGAISLFVRYFIPRFPLHHWFGECDGYNFPEVSHPPPYLSALPPLKNKYPPCSLFGRLAVGVRVRVCTRARSMAVSVQARRIARQAASAT